jgi:hypothetical protein
MTGEPAYVERFGITDPLPSCCGSAGSFGISAFLESPPAPLQRRLRARFGHQSLQFPDCPVLRHFVPGRVPNDRIELEARLGCHGSRVTRITVLRWMESIAGIYRRMIRSTFFTQ